MVASTLTLRGLQIATSELDLTEDDAVRMELVTTRAVTVEFCLEPAAASQLGSDLLYNAEAARIRRDAKRENQAGPNSIFAPLASIVDVGTVLGREEIVLTIQMEGGSPQQIRFRNDEFLALAKQAVLNLHESPTDAALD